jgi:hypothetical protein
MVRKNFCVRLDEKERETLQSLASKLFRSEGDTVRYIIKVFEKSIDEQGIQFCIGEPVNVHRTE